MNCASCHKPIHPHEHWRHGVNGGKYHDACYYEQWARQTGWFADPKSSACDADWHPFLDPKCVPR